MEYVTLNNGVKMPQLGYGVYQTPPEDTEKCVLAAIKNGYRSIDTAQAYGNEEGVGEAISKCGIPREELAKQYFDFGMVIGHYILQRVFIGRRVNFNAYDLRGASHSRQNG